MMLGYRSEEDIDKVNFERNTFLNIEEHNKYKQEAADGKIVKNITIACISNKGRILYFKETLIPVKDAKGELVFLILASLTSQNNKRQS